MQLLRKEEEEVIDDCLRGEQSEPRMSVQTTIRAFISIKRSEPVWQTEESDYFVKTKNFKLVSFFNRTSSVN